MRRTARITCLALVCMMISVSVPLGRVVAHPTGSPGSNQGSGLGSVATKIATVDVHSLPPADTSSQTAQLLSRHHSPVKYLATTSGTSRTAGPNTFFSPGSSSVSVIDGFDGLNQLQSTCGCVPPDVQVAAGPNHLVEMVNLEGAIFSKRGEMVSTFSLPMFFANIPGASGFSDPKVFYDSISGRWFASIIRIVSPGFDAILAVSSSSDPTGTWNIYALPAFDFLPDQPLLGVSDDKLVVSSNDFQGFFGPFLGTQYWILNKSEMLSAAAQIDFISVGPDPNLVSAYPVQSLSSSTTQYMVSVGGEVQTSSSTVRLISITGVPPGTVTVSSNSITISLVSQPPNALQLGSSTVVATNDIRVLSATFYQGKIWYSLNDACTPPGDGTNIRSCVRLTQIDTATTTAPQDFDFGAVGSYYYYPSLSIDNQGGLIVVFGYSSGSSPTCCYPSLGVTGRAASDPVNTLANFQVVKAGSAPDSTGNLSCFGRTNCARYGDYFGAGVDPTTPSIIWIAGEYHNAATGDCLVTGNNCWSTFIARATGQPSFTVSSSPTYLNLAPGSSGTSTITITSLAGFSGTTTLAATVSQTGSTATLGQSALTVPPTPATTSLTVTVPSSLAAGTTFTVTVTGTAGGFSSSSIITVTVGGTPSFTLSDNTNILTARGGSSTTLGLRLISNSGFGGTITLSATSTPSGQTFSFFSNPVTINPQWSTVNSLTISTNSLSGLYPVTVTATSGSQSQSVSINLLVTPINFDMTSNTVFTGVRVVTSGTLSVDAPSNQATVSGAVSVLATDSGTGATLFSTSYSISKAPLALTPQRTYGTQFILNVSVSPYPLSENVQLSSSAPTATSPGTPIPAVIDLTRNPDIAEYGIVTLSDVSIVHYHYGCTVGVSGCDPRWDLDADGVVDINDVGIVDRSYDSINYNQYLFSLSPNPSALTIPQGSSQSSAISLTGFSFAGTAALSTNTPSGLTATLTPSSLTGPGTSTLMVSASSSLSPGTFSVTVNGATGTTTVSTTIAVTIPAPTADFGISFNPSPMNINGGGSASSTLTLTSLGGFSGTVALTVSTSFSGLTATMKPRSVGLSSGGTGVSTLNANSVIQGVYTLTVTGTSGSLLHSVKLTVYVGDFLISSGSQSVSFLSGRTASVSISLWSVNIGITIGLSVSISKTGLLATLGQSTIVLGPGAEYGTPLSLSSTTPGTYSVTVTGSGGTLSNNVFIDVTVCRATGCGGI